MSPKRSLLILLIAATLGGCAIYERDEVGDQENNLSAAGFTVLPANTPAQQAAMARLTPHRVSQRIEGQHVSYIYADPTVCRCMYVGGQAAFGRFQQIRQQRRIASDQLQAAEMNQDAGFGWEPWGGYGPGYY